MVARIEHHVAVEVNDLLHIAQGHVEQDRHIAGNALQIPHMRDGRRQLDEAHAMAPHPAFRDLHPAALADDAAVPHALVFAAMAFPILGGAEDLLAEQPVHLGLEGAVVDRFRLSHLAHHLAVGQGALTPLHDPLGGGERDLHVVEVVLGAEVAVGHGGCRAEREEGGGYRSPVQPPPRWGRRRGRSAISRRRSPRRRGIRRWAGWGCCGGDSRPASGQLPRRHRYTPRCPDRGTGVRASAP